MDPRRVPPAAGQSDEHDLRFSGLPAAKDRIANGFVRAALLARGPNGGREHLAVELAAHTLDNLVLEELIGLWLAAQDAPLAPATQSLLALRWLAITFESTELAHGDDLGDPQPVALGPGRPSSHRLARRAAGTRQRCRNDGSAFQA